MPSTVIRRFDYSPDRHELIVEFVTGRRYAYCGVPVEEAAAMRAAFAKGRYFNAHIRHRYRFHQLAESDPGGDSRS
jgi:hypothetical protein